ncbi:MAG: ABC transporter substrate-binding protein [Lachnospiraceae bacterium]|nr:ABC transporter substrate-binding protein [Lachnospiraceae bacterium]
MKLRKKRWLAGLLGVIMMLGVLTGCGQAKENNAGATKTPGEKLEINVAALKGPTAIGMVQLMEDAEAGKTANHYDFTIAGAADEITANIIKGEFQIAAVPCNLASVLYNKTQGGVQVAAINVTSVLYIVETGNTIQSVEDLKGKTIYSTGKGTTPEYTLNYLLETAGIDPAKDVTIEFKSEATEVAAMLAESTDAIAMLPQPYVTVAMTQNENIRIALDIAAEWEKYTGDGSSVVTGVVLVNKAFAEEHPDAVKAFLEEYKASTEYVTANAEAAATLVEKRDIVKAAVAKKAIPYCNIVFLTGEDMKTKVSAYLNVLYEQAPNSVGGSLPGDDFYYGIEKR